MKQIKCKYNQFDLDIATNILDDVSEFVYEKFNISISIIKNYELIESPIIITNYTKTLNILDSNDVLYDSVMCGYTYFDFDKIITNSVYIKLILSHFYNNLTHCCLLQTIIIAIIEYYSINEDLWF